MYYNTKSDDFEGSQRVSESPFSASLRVHLLKEEGDTSMKAQEDPLILFTAGFLVKTPPIISNTPEINLKRGSFITHKSKRGCLMIWIETSSWNLPGLFYKKYTR